MQYDVLHQDCLYMFLVENHIVKLQMFNRLWSGIPIIISAVIVFN